MELETLVDTTEDDIGIKASGVKNLRAEIHAAGVQATQEIFTEDIMPEAKALSPVLTGKNRDSIAVSFRDDEEGGWISAWLSTHSGYGWLIEHGTSRNRKLTKTAKKKRRETVVNDRTPARPYIFPAIMMHVEKIADRAREIVESL